MSMMDGWREPLKNLKPRAREKLEDLYREEEAEEEEEEEEEEGKDNEGTMTRPQSLYSTLLHRARAVAPEVYNMNPTK